jgi:hypothetical protein
MLQRRTNFAPTLSRTTATSSQFADLTINTPFVIPRSEKEGTKSSYPLKLFREHASHMSEDFNYRITRKSSSGNSLSIENYLTSSLLLELEKLLKDDGYSLSHFSLPVPDHIGTASSDNKLILYELSYDSHILTSSIENDIPKLNSSQNQVFETICTSVFNNSGQTFFIYSYGGTGKIFLWTTLLNYIRSHGKLHL